MLLVLWGPRMSLFCLMLLLANLCCQSPVVGVTGHTTSHPLMKWVVEDSMMVVGCSALCSVDAEHWKEHLYLRERFPRLRIERKYVGSSQPKPDSGAYLARGFLSRDITCHFLIGINCSKICLEQEETKACWQRITVFSTQLNETNLYLGEMLFVVTVFVCFCHGCMCVDWFTKGLMLLMGVAALHHRNPFLERKPTWWCLLLLED